MRVVILRAYSISFNFWKNLSNETSLYLFLWAIFLPYLLYNNCTWVFSFCYCCINPFLFWTATVRNRNFRLFWNSYGDSSNFCFLFLNVLQKLCKNTDRWSFLIQNTLLLTVSSVVVSVMVSSVISWTYQYRNNLKGIIFKKTIKLKYW